MESYYRVECVNTETDECQGGYMCAINLMLCKILGVAPDQEEALDEALKKSDDERIVAFKSIIFCFTDIPMPDVYQADKTKKCVYIRKQNSMKYLIY